MALRYALGWKRTRYNQSNINPQPGLAEDIRKRFSEQLRAANSYDIELYREAVSLFDCQLRNTPFFGLRKRLLSSTRQLARNPHTLYR